ncbi:uncharacterized protein N7458_008309 [Penicillium daleae]|uniref:Selenoprotein W-like protein n=1 Tax=Penicillium daleae TaxID=63821 RepID=A0AAD6C2B0_9EURO|nr:uncharacterized protein N7458_008309 [Penicillium daleae]KAJ5444437.1 hypothetical protein N7458_008309 [Penicillium daleae]
MAPIEDSLASAVAASSSSTAPLPSNVETSALERVHLPRIAIKFCTQCRWMLRAAYFAQELLSTFSTDLGEVALVPVTGGIFTVTIWHATGSTTSEGKVTTQETLLWDRKRDGGFPADRDTHAEVKALKSLVRNIIAPNRDLGHTDRALKKEEEKRKEEKAQGEQKKECEDCS